MRSSNLKIILFVIAILLCASSILFSQEKPTIKVVMMTGPDQEGWSQVAEIYTKETGYPVIVEGQGRGEYHASLPTQLFSRSKAFDIVWILDTWIPEFAEAGVLMPLDEYTQDPEYDASDLLPVGVYKGIRYAVPVDYSHFYIYYRNDLIQEAPQTWDELYETAKKFSKAINPDSPTKYGITGDYITGEVLPQTWFNILWSVGGDVIDENGNVIVNNEKAIMAAKIWEKWAKEGILPPNITQLGWNDHVDQFVNGDSAIIVPGWNAGYYDIPRHSGPYANSWTAALLPGYKLEDGSINRTIYVQSWSFAVNAASKHKEEAAKFLKWATSKRGLTLFAETGLGMPSRQSVLKNPDLQEKRPDFQLALNSFQYVRYAPQVTFFSSIFSALDVALMDILNGKASAEDALNNAAKKISEAQEKAKK